MSLARHEFYATWLQTVWVIWGTFSALKLYIDTSLYIESKNLYQIEFVVIISIWPHDQVLIVVVRSKVPENTIDIVLQNVV